MVVLVFRRQWMGDSRSPTRASLGSHGSVSKVCPDEISTATRSCVCHGAGPQIGF